MPSARHQLAGDVVLMFQPAEELLAGAPLMIEEGILELSGRRADAAFGLHVFSAGRQHRPVPETSAGVMMSAADALFVKVIGRGGHGSAPHQAKDPVPVMAEMITGLQAMVARQFDAHDPVVVSVGMVKAGEAINVIPDTAEFGASLRMYSDDSRERCRPPCRGCSRASPPPTAWTWTSTTTWAAASLVTTTATPSFAARQIHRTLRRRTPHRDATPLGGSEDFADVLAQVPGSFICLDATPLGGGHRTQLQPFARAPLR